MTKTKAVRAARDEEPVRAFKSKAAWRTWLGRHHASARAIWLAFAKKGSGITSISYAEAVEEALCHGWIDGAAKGSDDVYWLQRFTPRATRSRWSQINCAKAEALIAAGSMQPGGLREIERAKADGRWQAAYAGPRAAEVPDDLQAALSRHRRALAFFTSLDSKNRYAILYRIQDAKTPETRARRIAKFIEMLKAGETIH